MARTSSGSARSDLAVKPTRSQKRTETTFRSSAGGTDASSEAAQRPQNRKPSGFSWPQFAQTNTEAGVYGRARTARAVPRAGLGERPHLDSGEAGEARRVGGQDLPVRRDRG